MLYILTGDVQIGKTRWLQQLVERLRDEGVTCYGVIAPGDWVASESPHANADGFEKLGIWNVLLPEGERIRFADRKDLAKANGSFDGESEAGRAGLGWHISDDALAKVNEHFATIARQCSEAACDHAERGESGSRGLLVVDELGRLELQHDGGLTEAVKLLEQGPQGCIQDALVVARDTLAPIVEERFAHIWGGCEVLTQHA